MITTFFLDAAGLFQYQGEPHRAGAAHSPLPKPVTLAQPLPPLPTVADLGEDLSLHFHTYQVSMTQDLKGTIDPRLEYRCQK